MRILVTGSKGFLGSYVVNLLKERGHEVSEYDIIDGYDIFDQKKFESMVEGHDLCIHLAAVADLYEAESDPSNCYSINIEGAEIVGRACSKQSTRLLFVSTVCAYGNNGFLVQDEDTPLAPSEVYAESKMIAEQRLKDIDGLDLRIVRPATFYGPGMRSSLAVSVFIHRILNGEKIQVHGSGKQTRCYTHVEDIAKGILLIVESWPSECVYNVSYEKSYSVLDLIKSIESVLSMEAKIEFVNDRKGQIHQSVISSARLIELGWKPRFDLAAGLLQTIQEMQK